MHEVADQSTIAALVQLAATGWQSWEGALQQILRIDAQVLEVERVGYWSLREEPPSLFCELMFLSSAGIFERGPSLHERDCPTYFQRLEKSDILAARDARRDPRTSELLAYYDQRGITSTISVPIKLRGVLVGVLAHEHVGALREWSAKEQQFALAVSQSVLTALEARARTRAELSERSATFLAGASWVLSETRDPQEVADLGARTALPTLGDDVALFVIENEKICLGAFANESPERRHIWEQLAKLYPLPVDGQHLIAEVIRRGQSILVPKMTDEQIDRYSDDREHAEALRALSAVSAMVVLLATGERVSGAMMFVSLQRSYDQQDLRLAEEYAQRVAAALENARLVSRLQNAIEAREEFISLASHELSTPLTSLRMAADALDQKMLTRSPENVERAARAVVRQTDRLERLVGRMIDSCEIANGAITIERQPIDLAEVTRWVVERLRDPAERTGSSLDLDASAPVWVRGDRRRLQQLAWDLLENAITFGRGRPVEITVRATDGEAVLSVRDHGPGIAPERQRDIFDRFHRGGLSTRAFGGFGLGLYVADGIARAHGGRIRVEGRLGEGTTFIFELPRLVGPEGAGHTIDRSARAARR